MCITSYIHNKRRKSVNSLLWSKYCGITTSAKLSGFFTTNISPSSDHEQIDESHVSIILASFLRKIGTVLNELSFSKSLFFALYFFWPPLFNGAAGDGRFDMMDVVVVGYYLRQKDTGEVECEGHDSADIKYIVSFVLHEKKNKMKSNSELSSY